MSSKNPDTKYTTQRVNLETVDILKELNLQLSRRGIRMNQSDLIRVAFLFIKSREWEFLEFVESGGTSRPEGFFEAIFEAASKPWFPYGDFRT